MSGFVLCDDILTHIGSEVLGFRERKKAQDTNDYWTDILKLLTNGCGRNHSDIHRRRLEGARIFRSSHLYDNIRGHIELTYKHMREESTRLREESTRLREERRRLREERRRLREERTERVLGLSLAWILSEDEDEGKMDAPSCAVTT